MPSSMTHTYFGEDVFLKLPSSCQKKVENEIEYFKLFCQGSDPFMFYHFFIGKKAKNSASIQSRMHRSCTRDFFLTIIKFIYEEHYINSPEVMAFLYGYICHYYLDLYAHPFIYYQSGVFRKDDPSTYQYNRLHEKIEYNIDLYMIEKREKIKPYRYRFYKNIFSFKGFSKKLSFFIDKVMFDVYGYQNISQHYSSSIKYMKVFFRLFNHDPLGIKLKCYQLWDRIMPNSFIRLEELSYHHRYNDDLFYLNLEHDAWCYPWDNQKTFRSSFFDLYNKALDASIRTISSVTEMLEKNIYDEVLLKKLFLDLSFATGLVCDKHVQMKYFRKRNLL